MLGTIQSAGLIWSGTVLNIASGIAALNHILTQFGDILATETGLRLQVE